jgi:hypothetical protein
MNQNDEDVYSTYGRRKLLTSLGAIGLGAVALTSLESAPAQAHGENVSQRTYRTEQSWGPITQWHPAADLTLAIDDGIINDLATISWRDQSGNTGSISFQSDGSSFLGYYQKRNEGPIAYRGTRK